MTRGHLLRTVSDKRSSGESGAPRLSRLSQLVWPVSSYLVTNVTVTLFWFLFFVLNHTKVIGRHNLGQEPNTLLLSNHQSMIDSFLVGLAAFYPWSWLKPHLIPWNPAAVENFFKSPLLAWLSSNWKCIPVREGRRDFRALHRMTEVLPHGVMTLFPEGTRTRDGSVGAGKPGAGLVALATRPKVIPVAILGMNEVLPIGCHIPRVMKRIYVCYGAPVDCSEFVGKRRTKEAAQQLVDRVMNVIRSQHAELQRVADRRGRTLN
ncbi:MAG: 1-acyl-sn-glycerol-3-phosphate acyltransferase [Gemmatimonadota bacterium]|nr:MAG: 1-acyl-sn-glycerol-3-phosphate acyltransferase [Gemmatimonadota bacterium]